MSDPSSNAIGSQESEPGLTPLNRLDGQMILPCGQEAVPASLSSGERGRAAQPKQAGQLGYAKVNGHERQPLRANGEPAQRTKEAGFNGILGHPIEPRLEGHNRDGDHGSESGRDEAGAAGPTSASGFTNGFWSNAHWLWCRDQKYRPVEPGTFPLAHGAANRVGRLRGYGNSLCTPQAQAFIEAYLEIMDGK